MINKFIYILYYIKVIKERLIFNKKNSRFNSFNEIFHIFF